MKCKRCGCDMIEQPRRSSKFTVRRRRIFRCPKCWTIRATDEYMRNWRRCSPEGKSAIQVQYEKQRSPRGKAKSIVMAARRRAEKNNLQFFKSDAEINEVMARIVNGVCELSGVKFSFGEEGKHWNSPSIDRIDSARGYTIDNVRVVCWAINIALNKWGDIGLKKLLAEWLRNGSMLRYIGMDVLEGMPVESANVIAG